MFGDLLRQHRRRLGLSQEELALGSGVSIRGLRKLEANEVNAPRPRTVRLLATALGLHDAERDRFCEAAQAGDQTTRDAIAPTQLPPGVRGFVGRAADLAHLDSLLTAEEETGPIIAIVGPAGVGKTTLAVHWAHRIRDRFPDGQIYLELRGFDPTGQSVDPHQAIRDVLDAFAIPASRIPRTPDAQVALYRSVLAGRRVLLVLDNARDAALVRPLLPASRHALVLVTSRDRLTPLVAHYGAHPLTVSPFTDGEARELLAHRLGRDRVAAEPAASTQVIESCGRLPLALVIAAARAAASPALPIAALADEVATASDSLEVFDAGAPTTSVRAAFSWSYQALPPGAARLFRLLGLLPVPAGSVAAAASLAAEPVRSVRPRLTELANAHLIAEPAPRRYAIHDLLKAYAADLVGTTESTVDRRQAVARLLDHYLLTAHAADRLIHPHRDPITLPLDQPQVGAVPEEISTPGQAMAYLVLARPTLVAAIQLASDTGFDGHAWRLAWCMDTVLDRRADWPDLDATWGIALAAAARLRQPAAQSYAYRRLARAETMLDRHDDAEHHLRQGLDLSIADSDLVAQANIHRQLAYLHGLRDSLSQAVEHADQALGLFTAAGDQRGRAISLNAVGWYHILLGDPVRALRWCRQAIDACEAIGDRENEAHTWDSIGYAHHQLHQYADAVDGYQQAIALYQEMGEQKAKADTLTRLGDTHRAAGDPAAARAAWHLALDVLTELDSPGSEAVRDRLSNLGDDR
jgi:tetratricopeptide (TPR) repeat protein/transcriptional regulator with XRE-family HTH domain